MSNQNDIYLSISESLGIFYTEKVISIISILFCIYVLYTSLRFRSSKSINSLMKNQLTLCKIQTFLLSISLFNSIHLPTILTIITYLSLKHSEMMSKNEKCFKWIFSIVSWAFALLSSLYLFFFRTKGTENDLVC